MTIQELGALGELIGGAAVIATLIYLAVQVRQSTQSIENARLLGLAQTYQMRSDAGCSADEFTDLAVDHDLSLQRLAELSPAEGGEA